MAQSTRMRKLHGVFGFFGEDATLLKRPLLMFDRLHVFWLAGDPRKSLSATEDDQLVADLTFLVDQGVLEIVDQNEVAKAHFVPREHLSLTQNTRDLVVRNLSLRLEASLKVDTTPIYMHGLPPIFEEANRNVVSHNINGVIRIGLSALPTPDEATSFSDLLDFKSELHDKQWAFRRFLCSLATKRQTEGEIRDDIEWTLNEYSKAMAVHKIKTSQSFVDVLVISPLEIIENLVKLNWSKIAKGTLSIRKRQIELREAEMKAPGRECAYVFDARRKLSVSQTDERSLTPNAPIKGEL